MYKIGLPFLFVLGALALSAQTVAKTDPLVQKIVGEISQDRIAENMQKLVSFGTRGDYSDPGQQDRGVGAARRWIYDQFRSYNPRLQVSFDSWKVKKQGTRIQRDFDCVDVVAVLPGTAQAGKRLVIGGHYDSLNIVRKTGEPATNADGGETAADNVIDFDKSVEAPAPGASDDASGTAVVMELARVMSQYKFEKTVVFIAFQGEEQGLIGSTLYADKALKNHDQIEAMLNNDIVGTDRNETGRSDNTRVHVYSDDPADSKPRELARYVRDVAQRYVPGFDADLVFRYDRFGRGGDHTPFVQDGYAAVRLTSVVENLNAQHNTEDTMDKASPSYATKVARVNGAALASLALAPPPPELFREVTSGANKGRKNPMLGRGKSKYDAVLQWKDPEPVEDLAGYAVVVRSTTSPFWDHQIFVGKVNEYTLPGLDIDEVVLGVKAIDNDGNESLVASYSTPTTAPASHKPIELVGGDQNKTEKK